LTLSSSGDAVFNGTDAVNFAADNIAGLEEAWWLHPDPDT
jgi:hypothetical protein